MSNCYPDNCIPAQFVVGPMGPTGPRGTAGLTGATGPTGATGEGAVDHTVGRLSVVEYPDTADSTFPILLAPGGTYGGTTITYPLTSLEASGTVLSAPVLVLPALVADELAIAFLVITVRNALGQLLYRVNFGLNLVTSFTGTAPFVDPFPGRPSSGVYIDDFSDGDFIFNTPEGLSVLTVAGGTFSTQLRLRIVDTD